MKFTTKASWLIIIVYAGLLVLAIQQLSNLTFSWEFESFFPVGDPEIEYYDNYRETFGSDQDYMLIAVERNEGIFDSAFLAEFHALAEDMKSIKGVHGMNDPTQMKQPIVGPLGVVMVPYMHIDQPDLYGKDSTRIYGNPLLVSSFFAPSGQSMAMTFETTTGISKAKSDSIVFAMDDVLSKYKFENIHVAGRVKGQEYLIRKMKTDMITLGGISICLVIIFLFLSYRKFWGIWSPLLVVIMSIIFLLAVMAMLGKSLDIMSALLPVIIFVVGISNIVHLLTKYLDELAAGKHKSEALHYAVKVMGKATALTSLTTAIGFLTLTTIPIDPVRSFGLYTSIGVVIAFVVSFTLMPALLALYRRPELSAKLNRNSGWNSWSTRLFKWDIQKRNKVLYGTLGVLVLAFVGIYQMKIDHFLLEDMKPGDPHRVSYEFFETQYSGVRPFEMGIHFKDSAKMSSTQAWDDLNTMDSIIHDIYPVGFMVSPVSLMKSMNQAIHNGNNDYFTMPVTKKEKSQVRRMLLGAQNRTELSKVYAHEFKASRFSGKIVDIGAHKMEELDQRFAEAMKVHGLLDKISYRQTGMAYLIDKTNDLLAANMIKGILIAFAVIGLIMGILFKSLRVVLITLVVNIIPLLVVAGFMGYAGIDLNISSSIIFTIAFGIAVDDTIHYMSKLRLELDAGKSLKMAIKRTSISTGKAIVVTSLILLSGFFSLSFSTFLSTANIGLLVSITLLMAVLSDLLLLPLLLMYFYKIRR